MKAAAMNNKRHWFDITVAATCVGTFVAVTSMVFDWKDRVTADAAIAAQVKETAADVAELVETAKVVLRLEERTSALESRVECLDARTVELEKDVAKMEGGQEAYHSAKR